MGPTVEVRVRSLRFMYGYTAVTSGAAGLLILVAPRIFLGLLGYPPVEPLMLGVVGSTFVAFASLSLLGLREPFRFAPVLLLQLAYKSIWFAGVILPRALTGALPPYALVTSLIFAVYVVGDLAALPLRALLTTGQEIEHAERARRPPPSKRDR